MGLKASFPRGSPTAQVSLYWQGPAAAELCSGTSCSVGSDFRDHFSQIFIFRSQKMKPSVGKGLAQNSSVRKEQRSFPGGSVVKNPPANAGDVGPISGLGKIPQAAEQLSPCPTSTVCALEPGGHNYWVHVLQLLKPRGLEPVLHSKRGPQTAPKSSPCLPQLEKNLCSNKDPAHSKINKIIYIYTHKGTEPELEWASLDPVSQDLGRPWDEPDWSSSAEAEPVMFPNKRNLEGVEKGKGPCRVAGSRGVGSAKDTP